MSNSKWWLLALAFAAVAFMAPGLNDPYYVPRILFVAGLCLPALLVKSRRRSSLDFFAVVALGLWAISAAFSQDVGYSSVGMFATPFDCFMSVAVYAAVVIAVGRVDVAGIDAATAVTVASIPLSLYALVQRAVLNSDPFLVSTLPDGHRVVASQGWPVYLGAVLAVCAACALGLIQKRRRLALAASALAMAMPAMWFTGTRGAVLAIAAAAFVVLPGKARWLAAVALPLVHLTRAHASLSDAGRVENWKIAWKVFASHPFVGVGPGVYPMAARRFITDSYIHANHSFMIMSQHAHNQVLQVLATTGIVGLIAYSIIIVECLRITRFSPDRKLLMAVAAAYVVVASLNPVPFSVTVIMAILFGAASSRSEDHSVQGIPIAVATACLASMVLAARLVAADACMKFAYKERVHAAAVADVSMAGRLNPWELRISSMLVDAKISERNFTEAIEIAHQAVLRHPGDSASHEVYGRAVLLGAAAGLREDPREALLAFEYAQGLAPTFMPLMYRRRAIAAGLGLADRVAAVDSEIGRITSLERN